MFLPIFLITYFLVKPKGRNLIVLLGSIIFYIVGVYKYPSSLIILFISIFINFILARTIEKKKDKKLLILGITLNVLLLVFFKYLNFILVSIISPIINIKINELNLILPLGISFYTFELISYLVDVYKKEVVAEKSFVRFLAWICFFPKMTSGPITGYGFLKNQFKYRNVSVDNLIVGLKYFILGLSFKVILANRIGYLWNDLLSIGFESISSILAWMGIIGYSLQIYFDFAGYSFMAIGIARMLGFYLPENFKSPYMSLSMSEFWTRWHMTLGSWFKKYIYIPLGGNRNGTLKTIRNLMVVWLVTGLWHGASWNFLIWGISLGVIICLEKFVYKKYLDKHKVFAHMYMLILIPLSWAVFSISDLNQLGIFIGKLFSFSEGIFKLDYLKYLNMYWYLFIAGFICSTSIPEKAFITKKTNLIQLIFLVGLFWISIYYLYQGMNNPFLYFSF